VRSAAATRCSYREDIQNGFLARHKYPMLIQFECTSDIRMDNLRVDRLLACPRCLRRQVFSLKRARFLTFPAIVPLANGAGERQSSRHVHLPGADEV
jgi:hypothetical protein